MIIRPLALGLLLALTAAAPAVVPLAPGPASAADPVETCQGQPATVVGSQGTEGPDVIVGTGTLVDARGGDDLICVRGPGRTTVLAGDGDDSVTAENGDPGARVVAILGPGDDRYVGDVGADTVTDFYPDGGDDGQGEALPDSGDDQITTLGGDDHVEAGGRSGPAQTDQVDLGEGADTLLVRPSGVTAASVLQGGPGADTFQLASVPDRRMGLDLGQRRAGVGERALALGWVGFEAHGVTFVVAADGYRDEKAPEAIVVRGSAGADRVSVTTVNDSGGGPVSLDVLLLGGDDVIDVQPGVRGRLNGGDGRDEVRVTTGSETGDRTVRLDLGAGRLTTQGVSGGLSVARFQDASGAPARRYVRPPVVVGDDDPNVLTGCAVFHGAGGNDLVRGSELSLGRSCPGVRAYGGAGGDRLSGTAGADVLQGGDGRDAANGLGGTDTCRAERRTACER